MGRISLFQYMSNITSTMSGVSLGKFIGIKYCVWYLPPFSTNLAVSSVMSISTVLLILYTMPASTATTERSFSVLRRLKTYLRTTMLQDRLTSLAVLHVHRDIDIDIDSHALIYFRKISSY
jgi:hypothetical protein